MSLSWIIEKGTLTDEKICYRYQCFHRAISPKNKYHLIFESLINRKFDLRISNEILLEYEEIISQKYNSQHLEKFLGFIAFSPHVIPCPPSFRFHLIETDPDDNKFVDCAICSNADAIVTSDKHFNILRRIEFPKVIVLSPKEFVKELLQMKLT